MAEKLNGTRIAILVTDGVEEVELTESRKVPHEAGAPVERLSPKSGEIQAMNHLDKSRMLKVDRMVSGVDPNGYDELVGVRSRD